MSVITITSENFQREVMEATQPVLVDFWASWCSPCRALSPVVDELAENAAGFKVCKVNVDEEKALARKYRVMSIPTLMVFKDGQSVRSSVGVIPKEEIESMVRS